MKFGRVLVTTALVAVLASSLFSGWLAGSAIIKTPTALAAGDVFFMYKDNSFRGIRVDTQTLTISAVFDVFEDTLGFSNDPLGDITVALTLAPDLANNKGGGDAWTIARVNPPKFSYELSDGSRKDFDYSGGSTTGFRFYPKGSQADWKMFTNIGNSDEFELLSGSRGYNTTPTGAFIGAWSRDTSKHLVDNYSLAESQSSVGSTTIKTWFNFDFSGLAINFYNDRAKHPPEVVIKKTAGNKPRPADTPNVVFKLSAFSGEGSGLPFGLFTALPAIFTSVQNQEWYTFEAYNSDTDKKIDNFYLLLNDDLKSYFYYDTDNDPGGVDKGKFGETIGDPQMSVASIDTLVSYVMNYPEEKRTNCARAKSAGVAVKVTGPTGKNISPEPNQNSLSDAGLSGEQARGMNQNCANIEKNGWLEYWGIENRQSADPLGASACSGNILSSALNLDIGGAIVKVISCFFQSILAKGLDTLIELLTETSTRSMLDPKQFMLAHASFGIGTAHAADLQDELKSDSSAIVSVWGYSRSLLNIVVVLALLAIAFANILHLNLNAYAAKKALPGLIIGVVGANASLLIVRFLVDVANAVGMLATQIGGTDTISGLILKLPVAIGQNAVGPAIAALAGLLPFALIAALILIIYFFFLIFVFIWALFRRLVMLYFLIMISPLGFAAYGIPGLQQYFAKWWDLFLRYLFLLPILLFGIALVVKLGEKLNTSSFLNANQISIQGMINILIMLAAASAILKLPGVITKGAVDVSEAAKKAFGIARQAPLGMASGMQAYRGWRAKSFEDRAKKLGVNDPERTRLLSIAQKHKDSKKAYGTWRARANIVGNPQLLKAWYEARKKTGESDTSIATLSSEGQKVLRGSLLNRSYFGKRLYEEGVPTPELIKGRRAAYTEKEFGADARFDKNAREVAQARDPIALAKDFRTFANRSPMARAITAKLKALSDDKALYEQDPNRELDLSHYNADQIEYLRTLQLGNRNWDTKELLEKETGIDTVTGRLPLVEAFSQASADYASLAELMRRIAPPGVKVDEVLVEAAKAMLQPYEQFDKVFDEVADEQGNKRVKIPLPTTGLWDAPAHWRRDNQQNQGGGGAVPSGGPVKVNVVGQSAPIKVDDKHLAEVVGHAQSLRADLVGSSQLEALAKLVPDANTPHKMDVEAMIEALKGITLPEFHPNIEVAAQNPEALAKMVHDMSVAAGSGHLDDRTAEAIERRLASTYAQSNVIDQENQEIASRLDEQKLSEIMTGSFEEALSRANEVMGGNIARINEAITQSGQVAKDQKAVLEKVVSELQGMRNSISGKGPNSLLSISKNMGPMIAKAMEVGHMSLGQLIKERGAASQATATESSQPATGSSESTPVVTPETPAQPNSTEPPVDS